MSAGPGEEHLSLDDLADLDEGIAENAAELQSHLDGCPVCRARAGQLRASRALLSTLPAETMPAEVAGRIDAALARERAGADTLGRGRRSETVVPLATRRPWWRSPAAAGVAAGVAVVGLASALVVGKVTTGRTSSGTASNANQKALATAPIVLKQWETGANYTDANDKALAANLVRGNPPPFNPGSSTLGATATAPSPMSVGSGPSYTQAELRQPPTLDACARLLVGKPTAVLAVDYARYDGKPAVIIVVPEPSHPATTLDVWVIRSVCGNGAADIGWFKIGRP